MKATSHAALIAVVLSASMPAAAAEAFDPGRGILLKGTVVTMDDAGTVIPEGNVLIRNGIIVAVWRGEKPPRGTPVGDAVTVEAGSSGLIFPGMINLHNHTFFDVLSLWPAPSSHVQPLQGRPTGREPYGNRYQWNGQKNPSPPEQLRLVASPSALLTESIGLNLATEVVKYAKVKAVLGGDTTIQGGGSAAADPILARNVDGTNFGRARIESSVLSIDIPNFVDGGAAALVERMREGKVDAWLVHLAEGVRDGDRPQGDPVSSRGEFFELQGLGLLTDNTVIVHGTGLERDDFAAMRAAPSIRLDGSTDGLGAKLVWSPLSNLLLYGKTTQIYEALRAGVLISLGTDWSPSGSRNLLGELKIADIALRDPKLLGKDRDLVPELSAAGKHGEDRMRAERALDRLLVSMVTRNPAKTVRWDHEVGSIEVGKHADVFLVSKPARRSGDGHADSPYRDLIDAVERDIRLVLVGGEPVSGDVSLLEQLKPGDYELIKSSCSCFSKAIDVTKDGVPLGNETFAFIEQTLHDSLAALGGDNPPPGGGQADDTNTYSYLKARVFGGAFAGLPDALFRQFVLVPNAGLAGGKLNIEKIELTPVLVEDDAFFFHLLGGDVDAQTGLIADPAPPFKLYPANLNQIQPGGNPFAAPFFEERWYDFANESESFQRSMGKSEGRVCLGAPLFTLFSQSCQR